MSKEKSKPTDNLDPTVTKRARGRPFGSGSKWRPEFAFAIEVMAKLGATNEEMWKALDISEASWYKWEKERPEMIKALESKNKANERMAKILEKIAEGYEANEVVREPPTAKEILEYQKQGIEPPKLEVRRVTTKHIPANIQAVLAYLYNRDPGKWKNKHDVNLTVNGPIVIKLED